jgi:hypothetical protein
MSVKHQQRRKDGIVWVSRTLVLVLLPLLHQWRLVDAFQSAVFPSSRNVLCPRPRLAGGPWQYRSSTPRFLGSASWLSRKTTTTTTTIQSSPPSAALSQTGEFLHPKSNSLQGNATSGSHIETASGTTADAKSVLSSKRELLRFAIPALGIYLANPLLSNIDNAFVGRTVGTAGLAALSPATICTDQSLYLFSFLGRATTGIVARAYALPNDTVSTVDTTTLHNGNAPAARKAASARTYDSGSCNWVVLIA